MYKALDDNQGLIRFLDAKAAFAVALLSAMTGKVLSELGAYFPQGGQPLWHQYLAFGFLAIATLAGAIVTRVLFPTSNPSRNVVLSPEVTPEFFLWELKPKRCGRILSSHPCFSRLAEPHEKYLAQVAAADAATLLRSVSAEVLKVSYIRQIKTDRLRALAQILALGVLVFVSLIAADATADKPVKPVVVQVQGPVSLAPPSMVPTATPPSSAKPAQKEPPRRVPPIKSPKKPE
jgi:hypothetical protein